MSVCPFSSSRCLLLVAAVVVAVASLVDSDTIGRCVVRSVLAGVSFFKPSSSGLVSPQLQAVETIFRAASSTRPSDYKKAREMDKSTPFIFPALVPGTNVSEHVVGEASALLLSAPGVQDGVVLHMHMGAYVYFDAHIFSGLASLVSRSTRAHVVSLHYRKAPEHPMPAALEDAVAAYQWLIQGNSPLGKINPKKIVLMGESAGGGLALLLMQRLREMKLPLPSGAALSSPWVDLSCQGYNSAKENDERDAILSQDIACNQFPTLATNQPISDKSVSPMRGSFEGLPPLMFTVAEGEVLRDSVVAAAKKARDAGVKTYLEIEPNALHCYQFAYDWSPETHDAFGRYTGFARMLLSQSS